jgi:hypothetical protein
MQSFINKIHWPSDEELDTAKVITDEDYDTWRDVDEAEWQSVVHPAGKWILCGGPFDERALDKDFMGGRLNIRWVVAMKATATMRDVFEAMRERPVYHYFEGLVWTVLDPFEFDGLRTQGDSRYNELPAFRARFGT